MSLSNSFSIYPKSTESDDEEDVPASFIQDESSGERGKVKTINETDSDESIQVVQKVKGKSKKQVILSDSEDEAETSLPYKHQSENDTSDEISVYESHFIHSPSLFSSDIDQEEEQFERQALTPRTRQSTAEYRPKSLTSDESEEGEQKSKCPVELGKPSEAKKANESSLFSEEEDELHSFDPESMPLKTSLLLNESEKNLSSCRAESEDENKPVVNNNPITWEALSSAVNEIQPKYTGKTEQSVTEYRPKSLTSDESEEGEQKPRSPVELGKPSEAKKANESSLFSEEEDELHSFDPESMPLKTSSLLNASEKNLSSCRAESEEENKPVVNKNPITWEELSSAVNEIQPKYTGKTGQSIIVLLTSDESEEEEQKPKSPAAKKTNGSSVFSEEEDKWHSFGPESMPLKSSLPLNKSGKNLGSSRAESEDKNKAVINKNTITWEELSAAVNEIQPKYTGNTGLATFNNQKALTIDRLKDIHGSLETCPAENILAEQPKGLKVTLMDHQKHALAWMNWRERQRPRGGILADDMGLGKTFAMISLVLDANQKKNQDVDRNDDSDNDEDSFRENQCWSIKGRRDYYDGGTLVVCPASLVRQWESEVEKHTKMNLISICVHHGSNRYTKARHLAKYEMVVTTYNIAANESKTHGALFGVKWERIVLDEAHVIRNHKSQSSEGVCNLEGKYRWALTGTPIQNKEMDLYAILKFLRCTPFDDLAHWKKWIDNKSVGGIQRLNTLMKSLMLRRTKIQLQENGTLQCLPEKQTELIGVMLEKEEMNVYQKIMIFSRTLFAQFLHQRAEKNNDLYYKPLGDRVTSHQIKDPNGTFYKIHQKLVTLHGAKEIQAHQILVLLLRLRQICCHPGLIDAMLEDEEDISNPDEGEESQPEIDLLEQLDKLHTDENEEAGSTHTESSDGSKDSAIYKASSRVLIRSNPVFDLNRPSSKIKKVLQVLEEKILKTSDKAIVVSQWTSVLDILKVHLCRKGVAILSLNGSVPVHKRQQIVSEFNDDKNRSKILLLSLTAGGVGLNLVGANHLLLIDLHWNPQLESQAQDRIYRVGQKKPVRIYKFMCKDTVEERIKALQDKKLAIANGVLTGEKAGGKLTMDDLRGLFGL